MLFFRRINVVVALLLAHGGGATAHFQPCSTLRGGSEVHLPRTNYSLVYTSRDCRSVSGVFSTYQSVPISIEPTTSRHMRVETVPEGIVTAVDEDYDGLILESTDLYDSSTSAGMTMEVPYSQLKRVVVDGEDPVQIASGFTHLKEVVVTGNVDVTIEGTSEPQHHHSSPKPLKLKVHCSSCHVQVLGGAKAHTHVLLEQAGGTVDIEGLIAEGSFLEGGKLTVDGSIHGLDARDAMGGKIVTSSRCHDVLYDDFWGDPCQVQRDVTIKRRIFVCTASACKKTCTVRDDSSTAATQESTDAKHLFTTRLFSSSTEEEEESQESCSCSSACEVDSDRTSTVSWEDRSASGTGTWSQGWGKAWGSMMAGLWSALFH